MRAGGDVLHGIRWGGQPGGVDTEGAEPGPGKRGRPDPSRCVQGPVVRLALTGRQAAALRAAVEMELAHQRGQELRLSRLIGAGLAGVARCGGAAEQYISGIRRDIAVAAELAELLDRAIRAAGGVGE